MKLTRERKIIGAVLVIALGGLGFDQLSGGGSAETSAEAHTLLLASTNSSDKPVPVSAHAGDGISLASRLSTLAQQTGATSPSEIRDVFRPADGWIAKSTGTMPIVAAADKFALDHKLSTVSMNGGGAGVAVVDGRLLHIGNSLDGYKLIAIDRQSALFEGPNGARAQLKLATESLAGR